ncbi:MAG: asparagine--tRNA ligase [Kiritimatiellae bacterium]|nr:asparagine--tRNA ligase [Kiritimatiellia bacterium]
MRTEKIKGLFQSNRRDVHVSVSGWVRTRRDSKEFSFLEINDGSCQGNLQIIADATLPNYAECVQKLHPGASVRVTGLLRQSQGAKQSLELQAETVQLLGASDPLSYPLGKQRIGFERLRELPHLRVRTNSFAAVARLRSALAFAVHQFFQSRGFVYVHTPIITASDGEGAGEMFQVTTLNLSEPLPRDGKAVDYRQDFFGARASLTVSGQLEGETYACGLGDIYTFGPTFRAENSNTRRHISEFWMIEPEMAFADLEDDQKLAEDFLHEMFTAALRSCPDELAFFDKRVLPGVLTRLEKLASSPFVRMTYTEAVEQLEKSGHDFEFKPFWGMDLQSEHERFLTEQICNGPVIVTNYPESIKAFYMRRNDDGKTVAAMDVLLPEVGEIIGGSQREERLDVLENVLREKGLDSARYSDYLDLRRYGTVPHAGFGLGFERLVQICSGMHNIRDVIAYPRAPGLIR